MTTLSYTIAVVITLAFWTCLVPLDDLSKWTPLSWFTNINVHLIQASIQNMIWFCAMCAKVHTCWQYAPFSRLSLNGLGRNVHVISYDVSAHIDFIRTAKILYEYCMQSQSEVKI